MKAVYKKEMSMYLRSPMGWILIALATAVFGFYFASSIRSGMMNMAEEFIVVQSILILILPLMTMRLFSEEKKAGTDVILYTAPVSLLRIILGKYLAAMTLLVVMSFSTVFHVIGTIIMGGRVDATFIGALLSFFFIFSIFIAIGLFISASTENQIVAAVIGIVFTFFVLFFYDMVAGFAKDMTVGLMSFFQVPMLSANDIGIKVYDTISWMNPISKMQNFSIGIVELSPLVYSVSLTAFFIYLTYRVLEKRRWAKS